MRLRPALAAGCAALCLVAGCSSGPAPGFSGAAEPAKAPPVSTPPAGTVTTLAPGAEGMVYDPGTDILAVAVREPNRLMLIQGATGAVLTTVDLPGHARHLQLAAAGGAVLVPDEDSNMLLQVALPGGEVTATPVGDYPHDAAQVATGQILVANEKGGTLSVVSDGAVVQQFADATQPGGVAAAGGANPSIVGVVDVGAFTLTTYDISARLRLDSLKAGQGPTHMIADSRGRFVVADTRGNQLLVYDAAPLALVTAFPLAGTPYGMAYDATRDVVWVTLTALNEVVAIGLGEQGIRQVVGYPTVAQPNTVAVDPASGRVWVASRATGELETIGP